MAIRDNDTATVMLKATELKPTTMDWSEDVHKKLFFSKSSLICGYTQRVSQITSNTCSYYNYQAEKVYLSDNLSL